MISLVSILLYRYHTYSKKIPDGVVGFGSNTWWQRAHVVRVG
jgi:hypothetical protein